LKADGSIVAWGYHYGLDSPPSGTGHTAIGGSAYYYTGLACDADGKIVSWGDYDPNGVQSGKPTDDGYEAVYSNYYAGFAIKTAADTTPPTLDLECSHESLWPPNHKMVEVTVDPNAEDNSGGAVTIAASVSSNEAENGTGDGDAAPDWANISVDSTTGVVTLDLRAERAGGGDGRVYTITITATDEAGNSASTSCEVTVPHDKKK
jgi:hypothetical protein